VAVSARLLERTLVYRVWMAPQTERKFAPIRAHNDLGRVRRVLDVGCGPGTNTSQFPKADYLGLDINERYIEDARRRFHRQFQAVDVTRYEVTESERYDFILVNSFLHHLPTPEVERILAHLATLLSEDGHVHCLELVLPAGRSVARALARWDRGDYARPLQAWRELFERSFEPVVCEPYPVGALSVTMWNMVYFKGRARDSTVAERDLQTS
jgi:SAM-dependent methyltransferase